MSKRTIACKHKRRYASQGEATAGMRWLITQMGASAFRLHTYSCGKGAARHWHFGHYAKGRARAR